MTAPASRLLTLLFTLMVALPLLLGRPMPAHAQFFDESLEQEELFVEDEDAFFEDRGAFGEETGNGGAGEPDFTEGDRFVDEELVPADQRALTAGSRRLQLTLGGERQTLPLNIAWGAGTGLLIGGWFALINEGNNRATQRSIGLGIVTGIILGAVVGTRTIFNPDAPRATPVGQVDPPGVQDARWTPIVAVQPGETSVGLRLTF